MKHVYTNENPRLKEFSYLLNSNDFRKFVLANLVHMQQKEYGSIRMVVSLARNELNRFLKDHDMFATSEVEHLHNIGNNNSFYVKDMRTDELFARLDLNDDMFGRVFCYGCDIDGKKISNTYHIGGHDKFIVKDMFEPDWPQYEFFEKPKPSQEERISKEVILTIRVPENFSTDDELHLGNVLTEAVEMQGYELLEIQPFQNIGTELEFIFDDELCVQDEHCECIDGYLWATNSLVAYAKSFLELEHSQAQLDSIHNISFYPIYNLKSGKAEIEISYDYYDGAEEKNGYIPLKMTGEKLTSLVSHMELYCQQRNHQSCLDFVNEARTHEGLPALDPIPVSLEETISPEQHASLDAMLANVVSACSPVKPSQKAKQESGPSR